MAIKCWELPIANCRAAFIPQALRTVERIETITAGEPCERTKYVLTFQHRSVTDWSHEWNSTPQQRGDNTCNMLQPEDAVLLN